MFMPWQKATLYKHKSRIESLLNASFMPSTPETALDNPPLVHTYAALTSTSTCNICQFLYSLIDKQSPAISFYEDYALLCLTCLYAPITWTSTLMTAADFLEIITTHFPDSTTLNIYSPNVILAIDIQLHFYIHRCFKIPHNKDMLTASSLQFLRTVFLQGNLTGSISGHFCFKTAWVKSDTCCDNKDSNLPSSLSNVFCGENLEMKSVLLPIILEIWSASDLFKNSVVISKDPFFTYPDDVDICQGPCMLSPSLVLKQKNNTASICPLCECIASHPQAIDTLQTLKHNILTCIENNVKLVDRIAFILHNNELDYIEDLALKSVIKNCSIQEIHKHFFCDPLCALNIKKTNTNILFKIPDRTSLKLLCARLATGEHLSKNYNLDCEYLETLVLIFKCSQICKLGKTTFLEIIRELDTLSKKHNLLTVKAFQTSQIYV
ncbi:orf 68 [Ateline gammaherpesvirus 3]|uniref:Packaging protein UL32 n=1 Tax=Ateline herpesvirus 3 TaxID=85618 RepID=Q9YTJ8_ATHV3|nr:orf 68 [Ateline gammaherpesvirus 3]AAC95593.1 orf 68 [Ateline gammaherpesvirus 3]